MLVYFGLIVKVFCPACVPTEVLKCGSVGQSRCPTTESFVWIMSRFDKEMKKNCSVPVTWLSCFGEMRLSPPPPPFWDLFLPHWQILPFSAAKNSKNFFGRWHYYNSFLTIIVLTLSLVNWYGQVGIINLAYPRQIGYSGLIHIYHTCLFITHSIIFLSILANMYSIPYKHNLVLTSSFSYQSHQLATSPISSTDQNTSHTIPSSSDPANEQLWKVFIEAVSLLRLSCRWLIRNQVYCRHHSCCAADAVTVDATVVA